MHEELDRRKVVGTVLGIVVFICCVLFFTYAWYEWRSATNTNVAITIQDAAIEFENEGNVSVENIGPILNIEDGVKAGFSATNYGGQTVSFNVLLNINSISDNLLTNSFKYVLVRDVLGGTNYDYDNPVSRGDFSNFVVGTNIITTNTTIEGVSDVSNIIYNYKFIVYIDGNMQNDIDMQENSMSATLIITEYDDSLLLNNVSIGSYVAYTGNNGCPEGHCDGTNANYVDDTNKGYCSSSSYKFSSNGWRVGYILDDSTYLISAGAPECVKTYVPSKSSTTTSKNFADDLAYMVSSNATYNSATNLFELKNYTVENYPTSGSFLNNKFTCINGMSSCSTLYSIAINQSPNFLTLKEYNTSSCYNSTVMGNAQFKNCKIVTYGSTTKSYYYGTDYILTKGGFQLSGTITQDRPYSGLYTCKNSNSSSYVCSKLYYFEDATGYSSQSSTSNTKCTNSTSNCIYYGSHKIYEFTDSNTFYSSEEKYLFGGSYEIDSITGTYSLKNVDELNWKDASSIIISNKKYTCFNDTGTCSNLYEISNDSTTSNVIYYTYSAVSDIDTNIIHLNNLAKNYCNSAYAYAGICDENTAWAMSATDFEIITGNTFYYNSSSDKLCYQSKEAECGYQNSLIDNGGYYWYATKFNYNNYNAIWIPSSFYVSSVSSSNSNAYGLRPILKLNSSVYVIGGTGTEDNPYLIGIDST